MLKLSFSQDFVKVHFEVLLFKELLAIFEIKKTPALLTIYDLCFLQRLQKY